MRIPALCLLLLFCLACLSVSAQTPANPPLRVRLAIEQVVFEAGQPIRGELTVHNTSDTWVKFPDAENLSGDLRLVTSAGEQFKPAKNDLFAPAKATELGPGGFLGFSFDASRMFPKLAQAGKYSLKFIREGLNEASADFQIIPAFDVNKKYLLRLGTPEGDLQIQLDPKEAPVAVRNIVDLARTGFYDGAAIPKIQKGVAMSIRGPMQPNVHRIVPMERTSRELLTGSVVLESSKPNEPAANFPTLLVLFSPKPDWQSKATWVGQVVDSDEILLRLAGKPTSGEKGMPPFKPVNTISIIRATITEQ